MMKHKNTLMAAVIAVLLAGVTVVILLRKTGREERVTLGYVSTGITGLCVQVMRDQGIPTKHGLELEYIGFANPSAMNNSFVLGKFDVNVAAGANVVALARAQGRKIQYFFPTLLNSVCLVVRNESPAKSLGDLKGRKVGWYGLQSGGGTAFYVIAQEQSLNVLKDFQMIDVKPPALWPLLERREVKAIVIYEPFVSRMLATGTYRVLLGPFWRVWEEKTGNKMEMTGLAAFEEWLDRNPEAAQRLIAIWREVALYIRENPRDVLLRYNRFTQLQSEQEIALGIQRIPAILATSWEGLDESITQSQRMLAADKVVLQSIPEGTIRKVQ